MFLVDTKSPAFVINRSIDTLDSSMLGGHAEILLNDLEVDAHAVLGEVDAGFDGAQIHAPGRPDRWACPFHLPSAADRGVTGRSRR